LTKPAVAVIAETIKIVSRIGVKGIPTYYHKHQLRAFI
jgi:hypothetical protein